MSPTDTLDKTVQKLRQYLLALEAGDAKLPPQFQTMFFMRCLDDRFEVLKQAFVIDSDRYTRMSIHELYTAAQSFTTSAKHLLSNSVPPRAAAAAKAPAKTSSSGTPSSSKSSSSTTIYSSDDIITMSKEKRCLCGRSGHTLDTCGVIHHSGYYVLHDKAKAQEHWLEVRPQNNARGGRNRSASAATPAPASAATLPPSGTSVGGTASVGGAAHASGNIFAAFESDDEDGLDQDVGAPSYANAVSGSKVKSVVPPYVPSSLDSCIGYSSHVASSSVASKPSRSVLIADSGATDHMWPNYEAFTSYSPLSSKYVTLADNTHTPVMGIGSVKILLDGHVVGLRNVLHVPSLRVPLYSLRFHSTPFVLIVE
jgi:hypothetical protein